MTEGNAHVVIHFRIIRLDLQNFAVRGNRLNCLALPDQRVSYVIVRPEMIRINIKGLFIAHHGLIQPPLTFQRSSLISIIRRIPRTRRNNFGH